MARKLRLSPLEGAIMAMLDEAGSEELVLVINSLGGDAIARRELLAPFEVAVRSLVARGLAVLTWSGLRGEPPVGNATRELLAISRWLVWSDAGYWRDETPRPQGPVGLARTGKPR
jgi:hypothetical protein